MSARSLVSGRLKAGCPVGPVLIHSEFLDQFGPVTRSDEDAAACKRLHTGQSEFRAARLLLDSLAAAKPEEVRL
ncbi:hypothetical protein [Kitasatospora kifunensis]|uniref:Uncharacterized protein n=1 Tax=Kitasatospora kifunensis TaxID=58351 RepID=A0A7W7VZX9_KITKI|nr:hypothetical protein [Kitasatospora kifunensis]MBB4929026.1 hypothetical protein [Kitasatospora kifunensis]